jgi:hypothetical protein
LAALTVASVAVLFAAACGGGSDAPDADNGGGTGGDGFAAYTRCLQENGVTVTMPSGRPGAGARPSGAPRPSGMPRPSDGARPGSGGGFGKPAGVDDATWAKAQAACASVRPSGRPGGGPGDWPSGGPGRGADSAYRNCLRDHGASAAATPDPAAAKACEVLKPSS